MTDRRGQPRCRAGLRLFAGLKMISLIRGGLYACVSPSKRELSLAKPRKTYRKAGPGC